jgi:hypothetical protein
MRKLLLLIGVNIPAMIFGFITVTMVTEGMSAWWIPLIFIALFAEKNINAVHEPIYPTCKCCYNDEEE